VLAVFPLTTARDKHSSGNTVALWGHLAYQQVSLQGSSKKEQRTFHRDQWFWLQLAI